MDTFTRVLVLISCLSPLSITARDLYAYRADGQTPDVKFYKVCFSPPPNHDIRLVFGDRCGHGYSGSFRLHGTATEDWPTIPINAALSGPQDTLREHPFRTMLNSAVKGKDVYSGAASKLEVSIFPDRRLAKVKSFSKVAFAMYGQLSYLAWAVPEEGEKPEMAQVVMQRVGANNIRTPIPNMSTKELRFTSNIEYGSLYEENENPNQLGLNIETTPVDLLLDPVSMINTAQALERYKLVACRSSPGTDKLSSHFRLFILMYPRKKITGNCFPIRLTISKNLIYHTKDMWIQKTYFDTMRDQATQKNQKVNPITLLPFPNEFDISPAYKSSPYDVKVDFSSPENSKAYVYNKKEPNVKLLEFSKWSADGTGNLWRTLADNKDIYLPDKDRTGEKKMVRVTKEEEEEEAAEKDIE